MKLIPILLLSALLPLLAQDPPARDARPFIRVTGEGIAQAKPDLAEINIGVITQGPTAEEAAAQNARQTSVVLESLKSVLGPTADMKTINYSLTPNQRFPRDGGAPAIVGYSANNTVHVRVPDLAKVGKVIDVATKFGSNSVQGLQFTVKDQQALRNETLRQAAQQARVTGDALAAALGLRVVRVLSVETGQPVTVHPFEAMAMAAKITAQTPVEPGSVDVRASVTLTLEVAPSPATP